jgi:hypothetical protein
LTKIEVLKNNSVVYTYTPGSSLASPVPSAWRAAPGSALERADWDRRGVRRFELAAASLGAELQMPRKAGGLKRLRQSVELTAVPPTAILRTNLQGAYKIWLNGALLVDTHTFQYDDPDRRHDCNAPDAHDLAGSPENFRQLGFYDIAKLGDGCSPGATSWRSSTSRTAPRSQRRSSSSRRCRRPRRRPSRGPMDRSAALRSTTCG